MAWRVNDPQGHESQKIKYDVVRWVRGTGLDLGCGLKKVWQHAIGVDNGHHWGQGAAEIKVISADDLPLFATESMDFVFSSHLLEHMVDADAALAEWWRVLKVGGRLILHLPHKDLYPRCGEAGSNPDHKHDFDNADVIEIMRRAAPDWRMRVDEVRDGDNGAGAEGNEYSLLQVYQKTAEGCGQEPDFCKVNHGRTCTVVRYGGMGDNLQASSALKELKDQGYYITYVTNPIGYTVMKENPHIDEFFLQDNGQIPDVDLAPLWKNMEAHCDKFVNLCESVEGNFLAIPQRTNYFWPAEVRREYLGQTNYIEFSHKLAQVKYDHSHIAFYPTKEEHEKALKFARDEMGGFNIMLAVAGSSIHKIYVYQDIVMRRVMLEMPEAQFVLVGGKGDDRLEEGWEDDSRVHCTSGIMPLRESLALARNMDCVVGAETGMLNAVSMEEDIHKVIYLSHSSNENLTRDWLNTTVVHPDTQLAPCHPCHQLQYGKGACPLHEPTGVPLCVAAVDPNEVFEGIKVAYEHWKKMQQVQEDQST